MSQINDTFVLNRLRAGPYFGFGMAIPATPLDNERLQFQGYSRNLGEVMYWTGPKSFRDSGLIYKKNEQLSVKLKGSDEPPLYASARLDQAKPSG